MFTGRRYDEESGLYHYRARAYDPVIGRFLQRDPLGYVDSTNLYSYVVNNPANYVDPWGLQFCYVSDVPVTPYPILYSNDNIDLNFELPNIEIDPNELNVDPPDISEEVVPQNNSAGENPDDDEDPDDDWWTKIKKKIKKWQERNKGKIIKGSYYEESGHSHGPWKGKHSHWRETHRDPKTGTEREIRRSGPPFSQM